MEAATPRALVTIGRVLAWNRSETVLEGTAPRLTASYSVAVTGTEVVMMAAAGAASWMKLSRRISVTELTETRTGL